MLDWKVDSTFFICKRGKLSRSAQRRERELGGFRVRKRTSMSARSLHWICFEALKGISDWVNLSARKSRSPSLFRKGEVGDEYALVDKDVERAVLLHVLGNKLVAELLRHEVSRDEQALSASLLDEFLRLLGAKKDQVRSATLREPRRKGPEDEWTHSFSSSGR